MPAGSGWTTPRPAPPADDAGDDDEAAAAAPLALAIDLGDAGPAEGDAAPAAGRG
jgi:hypothetical protein